jgi:hypothetical protein
MKKKSDPAKAALDADASVAARMRRRQDSPLVRALDFVADLGG